MRFFREEIYIMHRTSNKAAFTLDCFLQCTVPRKQYKTLQKGNTLNLQRDLLFVFEIIHYEQMLREKNSSIIDGTRARNLQEKINNTEKPQKKNEEENAHQQHR